MTTKLDPLYGITVNLCTEDYDRGVITSEEWKTAHHRTIDVSSAVDRHAKHQYDREELFAAFRWTAGVLARLVRDVEGAIREDARNYRHTCAGDAYSRCGCSWDDGITVGLAGVRWAVDAEGAAPEVSFDVPRERANHWVKELRRRVAVMLAEDLTPLDPAPSGPEHVQVLLTESTTDARVTP